jgi:PPK2 family polyphosphate:nucleotide phosphotransferase
MVNENGESEKLMDQFRVDPGEAFKISEHPTEWAGTRRIRELGEKGLKKEAKKYIKQNLKQLTQAQELLWASNRRSLLLVFQAMDAAGKDSTIKHVMTGVNPQGVDVNSFKAPSKEELDHNFLWRYWNKMPQRGRIGIFNRSYYEEVLIVKVHPEILESRPIPYGLRGDSFWEARYQDINAMEEHLCRSGTVILKFFLNVSKDEQKQRFLDRLNEPDKHWKFSESDIKERGFWDDYMQAFEECINATSTSWAPWFVIPADDKWKMRALVSMIITEKIQSLDLKYPEVSKEKHEHLMQIKEMLEKE